MRTVNNANGRYFPGGIEVYDNDFEVPRRPIGRRPSKLNKWALNGFAGLMSLLVVIGIANHYSGTFQKRPVVSLMDNRYGLGSVESMIERAKQRGN